MSDFELDAVLRLTICRQWFPATEDLADTTDADQETATDDAVKGDSDVEEEPAKISDPADHDEKLTAATLPDAPTAEPSDATQPPTKKTKVDDVRVEGDVTVESALGKDEKVEKSTS